MAFEFNSKPNRSEINRLNQAISAEEQNINALFQRIGQTYFAAHRNDPEENQAESIRGILDALERAKGYKEQINTLRGIAICPNCKAEVSIASAFCNHCGTKMPAPPQPAVSTNMNTVICQSCGARCSASQRFCNQCGSPLQQAQPAAPAAPTYAAAPAY
ncbi:MAG: zinc ribbon domain-containing protein, partial [Oscillospiraceae bacterium]|nr:zinc ribbon domain-containing protein [Oscillospiraceae bacterium]